MAAPPVLVPSPSVDLAREMLTVRMDAAQALPPPDVLWTLPGAPADAADSYWRLRPGQRWAGRAVLRGTGTFVLEVPVMSLDEAEVWHRVPGETWRRAVAGDRVPLAAWPFPNQFPAFPLQLDAQGLELIVSVANEGFLKVPVLLTPDAEFRAHGVRRANLSGMVLGLGFMVAIVCLLGAVVVPAREQWLIAGVAVWVLVTMASNNGYLALWLTPQWPGFNDSIKHFTALVMAGLFLLLVGQTLDAQAQRPWERWVAAGLALAGLAYATVQALWLPHSWRLPSALAAAALCIGGCAALCTLNAARGGRHVRWVALGTLALAAGTVLAMQPLRIVAGLDLRAAGIAMSFYTALLLMRQALVLRERYGRDVLSRDAVSASRDALTALWSYQGFQQRFAEAALREAAGRAPSSLMLFQLPGLPRTGTQHGMVLTERALVRFAALLQLRLGRRWAIGRLSPTHFGAISLDAPDAAMLVQAATRVLSHCARQTQPVDLVQGFDLRIVCRYRRIGLQPLDDVLREMEAAGRALDGGKRITLV